MFSTKIFSWLTKLKINKLRLRNTQSGPEFGEIKFGISIIQSGRKYLQLLKLLNFGKFVIFEYSVNIHHMYILVDVIDILQY